MNDTKKQKFFAVSIRDLQLAYTFSSHLQANNLFMFPWSYRNTRYTEQTSFTLSLVVSYSRPFSIDKYAQEIGKFCLFTPAQNILHKKILDFRNQIYAHSDLRHYDFKYFTETEFYNVEQVPFMRIERKENVELRKMIRIILKHVKVEEVRLRKILYLNN